MTEVLLKTDLPLKVFLRGKVRDSYDLGNHLLFIATDRISAFDSVLPVGIPYKGQVLNQLSLFWLRQTTGIIPNHLLEPVDDLNTLNSYLPESSRFDYPDYLVGRSMIVKKVKRVPVECVVRGYLAGSAWEEYQKSGTAFGQPLPKGMKQSQKLPEPLFTPTTKADSGHDLPLSHEELAKLVGGPLAANLKEKSLAIYQYAVEIARRRGIIIADTKFEFGQDAGRLVIIDEVLTPDSSRFWDAAGYKEGESQPSFDKQYLRDWLVASGWNKEPPAPMLPADVIAQTSLKYIQAFERLTSRKLAGAG